MDNSISLQRISLLAIFCYNPLTSVIALCKARLAYLSSFEQPVDRCTTDRSTWGQKETNSFRLRSYHKGPIVLFETYGIVWLGIELYGVRYGVVWYSALWRSTVWYSLAWYDIWHGIWYDIWYDMLCYGMAYDIWHGIWYDIWYDIIWYDLLCYISSVILNCILWYGMKWLCTISFVDMVSEAKLKR